MREFQMMGMDLASGKDRLCLSIVSGDGKTSLVIDRDELNGKTASRKPEREFIARALVAIVERHGARVEQMQTKQVAGWCSAGIDLTFSLNGVGASISLDNLHGGARALIAWYGTERGARNFSRRFASAVGDVVGTRLHHKATSCPTDWYSLAMLLDGGLCLAARGEAFEPDSL